MGNENGSAVVSLRSGAANPSSAIAETDFVILSVMFRVALLVESSRSYGRDILSGVRRFISEGQRWATTVELRDLQSPTPAWLSTWDGDGILCRSGSAAMAEAIRRTGVPAIELRSKRFSPTLPFVGMENRQIATLAANHLLEKGLRHFGVYGLRTESFFEVRRDAFVSAIAKRGHSCDVFLQTGRREKPSQWQRQQSALGRWLNGLPKPIGILACTDQLGYWLLEACREQSIRVPDEVAVIGVEGDETLGELSDPPLSSVRLAGVRVGHAAAAQLHRWMLTGRVRRTDRLFAPEGIRARRSSDWIAAEDPHVAAAIRWIREHACHGGNVEQLAVAVGCSRSTLERRFRDQIGRSPNQELVRTRLAAAESQLRNTSHTLDQIAKDTGFRTAAYLHHRFREAHGRTPGSIRPGK